MCARGGTGTGFVSFGRRGMVGGHTHVATQTHTLEMVSDNQLLTSAIMLWRKTEIMVIYITIWSVVTSF